MKTIDKAKTIKVYSPKGTVTHTYKRSSFGEWMDAECVIVDIVERMKFHERFTSHGVKIVMR
uniref:Uncharacterized protein n=1 Tax=Myoviridae sp. ctqfO1 TaxID=2827710 RepID=A0A8S5T3U1_9CAUD|nr:MAG TPA: hypothetical protein [Myoviridae sp. ctqfO1]